MDAFLHKGLSKTNKKKPMPRNHASSGIRCTTRLRRNGLRIRSARFDDYFAAASDPTRSIPFGGVFGISLVMMAFVPVSGNAAVPDESPLQPASRKRDVTMGRNRRKRPREECVDLSIEVPQEGRKQEQKRELTTSMCVRSKSFRTRSFSIEVCSSNRETGQSVIAGKSGAKLE
jgi:hypothetical protein